VSFVRVPAGNFLGRTVRRLNVSDFVMLEAIYESGLPIERHIHEKAYLSLVVAGDSVERYRRSGRTCPAAFTAPPLP
jgi:hypothetical protein